MRVRAIDSNGDWTFGKGKNNYKVDRIAIAQNIQTRLNSFYGNCFFAVNDGIDWFNLLGAKDQAALNLAISAQILNTDGVTGILQISIALDDDRNLTVQYRVQTIYSDSLVGQYTYNAGAII